MKEVFEILKDDIEDGKIKITNKGWKLILRLKLIDAELIQKLRDMGYKITIYKRSNIIEVRR